MSRAEGFAVMDVSTSICDDPKFRRLQRENPELVPVAFAAYVACMAESWKAGKRVSVDHAWPAFLPFDRTVAEALIRVGLLDRRGLLAPKAWRGWFEPARERRSKARERWARYNASRTGDTTLPPRGNDVDTATSVPSVRSGPTGPSVPSAARARGRRDDGPKDEHDGRSAAERLSDEFKAGKLTELEYQRRRRELVS